eukprot:3530205-Prymnesium_polylepis.1
MMNSQSCHACPSQNCAATTGSTTAATAALMSDRGDAHGPKWTSHHQAIIVTTSRSISSVRRLS